MGTNSKIEWTDKTWNPVTGCTKVSRGCKNCYAEIMYERFHGHGSFKEVISHQDRLSIPLKWKKPSMVFVNSMSDLFHEDVPFLFINAVFSVMSDVDHHTYQVLTKRPERMVEFFNWKNKEFGIPWAPKENVWLGVSVEDQKAADQRIPLLLQVPAAVRFLSCEPLLGPLDLKMQYPWVIIPQVNWVIVGGESGHHARPMHPGWARSIRDQCESAGVAFFFKQWGEFKSIEGEVYDWRRKFIHFLIDGTIKPVQTYGTFEKKPEGLVSLQRVGKKAAGRLIDGVEHNAFPKSLKQNIWEEN